MTDDIVTRLRRLLDDPTEDAVHDEISEAADEIEYLRNEIAEANSEYQKLWNKHNELMRDRKYPLTNNYIGDI